MHTSKAGKVMTLSTAIIVTIGTLVFVIGLPCIPQQDDTGDHSQHDGLCEDPSAM